MDGLHRKYIYTRARHAGGSRADANIDFEVEVNYELEFAAASAAAEKPDSEWLEASQSNNTSDLFECFFREQARLAFPNRGN